MIRRLYMAAALFLLLPALALAQAAPPDPVDWKSVAQGALMALTGTITFLILWGVKFLWSKIPAMALLYASLAVGPLVNVGIDWFTAHQSTLPWYLAMIGGAVSVALREFISTPLSKGAFGSVSVTKGML